MYRQFDGYINGHGKELGEFLKDRVVVNGYNESSKKISNGMGCLAASLVSNFKDETGGIYLFPTNTKDSGQEFEYHVYVDKVVVKTVGSKKKTIFTGSWYNFNKFANVPNPC
jgi:hypothetical protein